MSNKEAKEQPALRPCRSPYCECSVGQCSHPGFYDARGEPLPPAPPPECQTDAEKTAFAFGWWKALESVRQKPAQQEPIERCMEHGECFGGECIYTSPPAQPSKPWVGLTDEDVMSIVFNFDVSSLSLVAKAIEAKLREKNT